MKINWKINKAIYIITPVLLIVLIIILLPNFLTVQGGPARQPEGANVTGTMNRAQQAYF